MMIPTDLECERCGRDYEGLPSQIEDLCLGCLVEEARVGPRPAFFPEDDPIPYQLTARGSRGLELKAES